MSSCSFLCVFGLSQGMSGESGALTVRSTVNVPDSNRHDRRERMTLKPFAQQSKWPQEARPATAPASRLLNHNTPNYQHILSLTATLATRLATFSTTTQPKPNNSNLMTHNTPDSQPDYPPL